MLASNTVRFSCAEAKMADPKNTIIVVPCFRTSLDMETSLLFASNTCTVRFSCFEAQMTDPKTRIFYFVVSELR